MRKKTLFIMAAMSFLVWNAIAQENVKSKNYRKLIKQYIYADYKQMYKQPEGGALLFPYLTPGSKSYAAVLWDWQGPIWGISNYMVFRGLADYGFRKEARQIAVKTIALYGADLSKNGTLHEYYEPDTGAPIINPGFQNWNYLVLNMLAWTEGRTVIREF